MHDIKNEWALLQNQFDSYEKYSLLIKLIATVLLGVAYFSNNISVFVVSLLLVLWGQDAIWKTFQSRIENRLLIIENSLLIGVNESAYQFNSQYQNNRPNVIGLFSEYFCQAFRPTIAFPHAILVLLVFVEMWLSASVV